MESYYFKVQHHQNNYGAHTFEITADNYYRARRNAMFICFGYHADGIFYNLRHEKDKLYDKLEDHRGDQLIEITREQHLAHSDTNYETGLGFFGY